MTKHFNTVGILGRVKNSAVKETLIAIINHLSAWSQPFLIEKETAEVLDDTTITTIDRELIGQHCDLLIVIGGDGSLLHAAHDIVDQKVPVLGINRGSFGFLTDIHPKHLEKIKKILDGEYHLEKRFLLTTIIRSNDEIIGEDIALNEVAIIPDSVPHMIEFELYIDDQFVYSQDSDGLIVATPTGSTAYALSGGGPILHPQLDALVLVPMFPHSLNCRPIVIEGNRELRIHISPNNITTPRLSCDGRACLPAPANSQIIIHKKAQELILVHPRDYDYYETLRSKLHWGKKLHYPE